MDVNDFFYLKQFDNHFIDNFLNTLMNKKLLKKHYTSKDVQYFDIQIGLDEDFIFSNFNTRDINDVTLIKLSEVCIKNAISLQPIADILNEVRSKSNYYPVLKNAKVYLKTDDIEHIIKVNYYITIALVPDHLTLI